MRKQPAQSPFSQDVQDMFEAVYQSRTTYALREVMAGYTDDPKVIEAEVQRIKAKYPEVQS